MIGSTISHYRILEKLGGGGMGVVYKAQDLKLGRAVALKFLPPELTLDVEAKERFIHEAKAASSLDHNNICTVYDVDESADGRMFIAMACYEGETLKKKIEHGRLKVEEATDLAIQIAQGLAKAHEGGIVHRDIKPANIMITKNGVVKIVDFGLAKLSGQTVLTRPGSTMGTVAYMSPEQARGERVDHRTDIWSLGMVLYEMLTGRLPFKGEHEAALIYSIVNEEPSPIHHHLPTVSPELVHVLNRSLAKNAEDRYQSVNDMAMDLRRPKKDTSRGHVDPSSPSGVHHEYWMTTRKDWPTKVKVLATSAVVLVLLTVVWLVLPPRATKATFAMGRVTRVTAESGIKLNPAVSPDGKLIAFSAYNKGTLRVHVKQVMGGHTICLTDGMAGYHQYPQWSADGSEIAFLSFRSGTQFVVPSLGGAPRRTMTGVRSPDGSLSAFVSDDTLYTQSQEGSDQRALAVQEQLHSLAWSPDGTMIAAVSGNPNYASGTLPANAAPSTIVVIALADKSISKITKGTSLNMSPQWAYDSRHLFFVSDRDGTRDIFAIALDQTGQPDGRPTRLTTGLNAHSISLSSDSKTLVYSVLTLTANIWSVPIPKGRTISVKGAAQVTTGNQAIEGIDVSPDGQWLAYDSNREGNQDIYKIPMSGGEPIRLTTDPSDDCLPTWSPDGLLIAFYSFRVGNRDLFVMLNDGTQQQRITSDPAHEFYPDWSPDGNQLCFASEKSGQREIYVISRKPGTNDWGSQRQLTFDRGGFPRWSPDGQWIAYTRDGIRVISPEQGPSRVLVPAEASFGLRPVFSAWSLDSRTVYYKARDAALRSSFWSVPLSGGDPKLLVTFDDPSSTTRMEFDEHGGKLYFTMSNYECDIWKMELLTLE